MSLYFAYGSNLNLEDLTAWAARAGFDPPDFRFVGAAWLPDHRLAFHYYSQARKGGALDVVPCLGSAVPGALFETEQWDLLDAKEGAGRSYERIEHPVLMKGEVRAATTYRVRAVRRQEELVPPTPAYSSAVEAGLARWGLDAAPLCEAANGRVHRLRSVFVYGTLMRGHSRAPFMERHRPIGVAPAIVPGTLLDLGPYPGLLLEGATTVHGEVWSYSSDLGDLLGELDEVEDFEGWDALARSLYRRVVVEVPTPAWTYVYQGPRGPVIPDGRWLLARE
ncbi:MAG: gamma-glutamylcyclotransferase [Myxococcota bacterium]